MALLAVLCLGLGVLPTYVIPVLGRAVAPASRARCGRCADPAVFHAAARITGSCRPGLRRNFTTWARKRARTSCPAAGWWCSHRGGKQNPVVFAMSTSYMVVVLVVLLGVTYGVVRVVLTRRRRVLRRACWDGGVRRLLPEMTYTATGFSNPVRVIFEAIFHPTTIENKPDTVAAHFRMAIHRQRKEVHIVDRFFLRPTKTMAWELAKRLAGMHHGRLNAYLAYVLFALLLVLLVAWALTTGV